MTNLLSILLVGGAYLLVLKYHSLDPEIYLAAGYFLCHGVRAIEKASNKAVIKAEEDNNA